MDADWKKIAIECSNKDWSFSSAFAWRKAVEIDPRPVNLIQYADQLRLSGDFPQAQKVLEGINVADIPTGYQFVFYIRTGMLYDDQGRIDEAIESYQKSIELEPGETYPYILGDFKHAIQAINQCLGLDPDYPNAKNCLADFEYMEQCIVT